jgi:hypothetical protein
MPDAEDPFDTITSIMETRLGFTRQEWNCLLGAHVLGRCDPSNTGYRGPWVRVNNSNIFDNRYFQDMLNIGWKRQSNTNGQTETTVTDINQPVAGKRQFQDNVTALASPSSTVMLNADITMFWQIEGTASSCAVTHDASGCAQRLPEFNLLSTLAGSQTSFFNCFTPAFQKLSELGQSGSLLNVAP